MEIDGTVAIVTGAGSGIGLALAESLGRAGASILVCDIDGARAEAAAQQLLAGGCRAIARQADASLQTDIRRLIDYASEHLGPVDIYVANAGITGPLGLPACDTDWDGVLDTNLRGHIRAATVLVPEWVERGRGYFVSIASAAGMLNHFGAPAYAASKAAAIAFAEWLCITYGDDGVGVSCVCPMGVSTSMLTALNDDAHIDACVATRMIVDGADVIAPEDVAAQTLDAVRHGRFLVTPQTELLELYRAKAADYDGWVTAMRRHRNRLVQTFSPPISATTR
jgi:NAD(P)-dependent dehydrogenase (short-subunit alcohol dehydrogenase family)